MKRSTRKKMFGQLNNLLHYKSLQSDPTSKHLALVESWCSKWHGKGEISPKVAKRVLGYIHTVPNKFLTGRKFQPDILFTRNCAKVSFSSDGTDNQMKFVTLVGGFTISSCAQHFFNQMQNGFQKEKSQFGW